MRLLRVLTLGVLAGLVASALGGPTAPPADPVATIIAKVHVGMTNDEAGSVIVGTLPLYDWEFCSPTSDTGVVSVYTLQRETTLVLHYSKETSINVPPGEKITAVDVNRFADLKREVPADLYEHVRMVHDLPAFTRQYYDPAALIRVVNDLQPLGAKKALEVLRVYERLQGDEVLAMREAEKAGQPMQAANDKVRRQRDRALFYGIDESDYRLLPIPGLLFVERDGKPIKITDFYQPDAERDGSDFSGVIVLSDDIPFVPWFIEGVGGQVGGLENEFGRTVNEEEMRVRPTLLRPKGDPLSAAEALLASPQWMRIFRNPARSDQQNRSERAWRTNVVRLQALCAVKRYMHDDFPPDYDDEAVLSFWRKSLESRSLRGLRWDGQRQEFVWPASNR